MKNHLCYAFTILAIVSFACGAHAQSHLAFRLVDDSAKPVAAEVEILPSPDEGPPSPPLAVGRRVLLNEHDIQSVEIIQGGLTRQIGLNMTPQGAKKLKQITSQNIGHRLAIVLDGKLIMAPRILTPITKAVALDFGPKTSDKEFHDFFDKLNGLVVSPTSQPTTDESTK